MAELEQIQPGVCFGTSDSPHADVSSAGLRMPAAPPMKRCRLRMKTVTTPTFAASSEIDPFGGSSSPDSVSYGNSDAMVLLDAQNTFRELPELLSDNFDDDFDTNTRRRAVYNALNFWRWRRLAGCGDDEKMRKQLFKATSLKGKKPEEQEKSCKPCAGLCRKTRLCRRPSKNACKCTCAERRLPLKIEVGHALIC